MRWFSTNRAAYTLKNTRLGKSTVTLPETPKHLLIDLTKTSVVENEAPLLIAKENLWLVYDESGKEYSGLVLNDNGRWVLEVPNLYRVPEKLRIRPFDVTAYKAAGTEMNGRSNKNAPHFFGMSLIVGIGRHIPGRGWSFHKGSNGLPRERTFSSPTEGSIGKAWVHFARPDTGQAIFHDKIKMI
jgi:hypothetical protein